jgi:hypothetical protein
MSPWLKAGLVGGAVVAVLNLLGIIPCVGIFTCALGLLAYVAVGGLAAYWMPSRREAGSAAGQGALAAVVAAAIGGIVNIIVGLIQLAIVGTEQVLAAIPPEMLQQMQEAGVDPELFEQVMAMSAGPGGVLLSSSVCCLLGILIAAGLGAIGGAIYAGMRPD